MSKGSFACAVVFVLLPFWNPSTCFGSDGSRPSVLVDPQWLDEHRADPSVRVLEVGQQEDYQQGHLPDAQFVDWIIDITDSAMPERYNIVPQAQFKDLMCRLGVRRETVVVLYDRVESRLSTRMLWTLRYYGHKHVKILDGGAKAWADSGRSFSVEHPIVPRTKYQVARVDFSLEAKRQFIYDRLGGRQIVLIDGRPSGQYSGEQPGKVYHTGKPHSRRGHVPNAVSIPWSENLSPDGRFKSVSELRKLYKTKIPSDTTTIVTYCNEGLHAAHPWFVLTELLGYEDVRLYDDSMSEWANLQAAPLHLSKKR